MLLARTNYRVEIFQPFYILRLSGVYNKDLDVL